MRTRTRHTVVALLLGATILSGCKPTETKSKPPAQSTVSTSNSTGSGGDGGSGGAGGSGGFGGAGGSGGAGAGTGGAPAEDCYDGIDGDGDGFVDCLDHESECKPLCVDTGATCMGSKVLSDPSVDVLGDNTEFAQLAGASCGTIQPNLDGHANVYKVTAAISGIFDATVTPVEMKDDLLLTVRKACDDPASELACGDSLGSECVRVAVQKGDELFLLVSGYSALTYGPYHLSVKTRAAVCGDKLLDPSESCDDGNALPGDGCSAACTLELSEVEDNGTVAMANAFKEPMIGRIEPTGDVDVMSFDVIKPNSSVTVTNTVTPGTGCRKVFIDSYLELIGTDGVTVLAQNDDNGGPAAKIIKTGLAVGKYYLRLKKAPGAPPNHTFAYRWSLKLQ